MVDRGSKYGDQRLNQRMVNPLGEEKYLYDVTEDGELISLKCLICEIDIFGLRNLTVHENGKSHCKKLVEGKWQPLDNSASSSKPIREAPVSGPKAELNKLIEQLKLDKDKVAILENSPTRTKLDTVKKQTPMIGLEYLVEVQDIGTRLAPDVFCLLCEAKQLKARTVHDVKSHVTSATHRLRYLECFFPTARRKFASLPNLKVWKIAAYDFLESVALRIETKFGRHRVLTVQTLVYLNTNLEKVKALLELTTHFKESASLNFGAIPDPFESFKKSVPAFEWAPPDMLPPVGKPGIELSAEYRGLLGTAYSSPVKLDTSKPPSLPSAVNSFENTQPSVPGVPLKSNASKAEILSHISELREKLSFDELMFTKLRQYRKDVETTGATNEAEDSTDLGSLKLRKPPPMRGLKQGTGNIRRQWNEDDNQHIRNSRVSPGRARKSRSRSISPFVQAMETWDKFKKMETTMLKNVQSRRELYQKRPEDHPNYGEEWKLFWKKRYNELIQIGRDPNCHDFKVDWIPFWEKKLAEFFDMEVLEKTDELMRKFNLTTVNEPKREDYEREKPPPLAKKRSLSPKQRRQSPSPAKRRRKSPSLADQRRASPVSSERRRRRNSSHSPSPPRRNKRSLSPVKRRSRSPQRNNDDRYRNNDDRSRGNDDRLRNNDDRSRNNDDRSRNNDDRSRNKDDTPRKTRNPSPPGPRRHFEDKGRTGPSRLDSQRSDAYSGLTELEDRRDRGRSRSRGRSWDRSPDRGGLQRAHDYHRSDASSGEAMDLTSVLRVLSALEDSLGSLGPHVNRILAKTISLEQKRVGAGKVILEDPDSVSIMDMVKEKLHGQMMAGLLRGSKMDAVRVSLDNLTRILQGATKKRTLNPIEQLDSSPLFKEKPTGPFATTEEVQSFIAKSISTVLVATGRDSIPDSQLEAVVTQLMKELAVSNTNENIAKVAKEFGEAVQYETRMAEQAKLQPSLRLSPHRSHTGSNPSRNDDVYSNDDIYSRQSRNEDPYSQNQRQDDGGYNRNFNPREVDSFHPREMSARSNMPAYVTPTYADIDPVRPVADDPEDDFTTDELKSLVDNFNSLSKQEQDDLIQYMKRMQTRDPNKMKQILPLLKGPLRNLFTDTREEVELSSDSEVGIIEEARGKVDAVKFKLNSTEKEQPKARLVNVFGDTQDDSEDEKDQPASSGQRRSSTNSQNLQFTNPVNPNFPEVRGGSRDQEMGPGPHNPGYRPSGTRMYPDDYGSNQRMHVQMQDGMRGMGAAGQRGPPMAGGRDGPPLGMDMVGPPLGMDMVGPPPMLGGGSSMGIMGAGPMGMAGPPPIGRSGPPLGMDIGGPPPIGMGRTNPPLGMNGMNSMMNPSNFQGRQDNYRGNW